MSEAAQASLISSHSSLLASLIAQLDGRAPSHEAGEVPVATYLDPDHFAREQQVIFSRLPQIVAVESELAEPGSRLAVEIAGVSLLLVRGQDGEVRAFRNACRHRSTRLVEEGPPCQAKAIVCPYHGWTYDLAGCRLHAPHAESFCGLDRDREALVPAYAATRDGFVFASLEPIDLDTFLAPIAPDLSAMRAGRWHLYRRKEHEVAGNWKLIVDAFLDGYHIRWLHRDTLYRFFIDTCFDAQQVGDHIRSLVGRRTLVEARRQQIDDLCAVATPSYQIFPNTVLILHPDYLSVTLAIPRTVDRTRFVHLMLIPEAPKDEQEASHWNKSFQLIDGGVFAAEDLFAVEAMHRGMETGANRMQLFGQHEFPALWFHRRLAHHLDSIRAVHS